MNPFYALSRKKYILVMAVLTLSLILCLRITTLFYHNSSPQTMSVGVVQMSYMHPLTVADLYDNSNKLAHHLGERGDSAESAGTDEEIPYDLTNKNESILNYSITTPFSYDVSNDSVVMPKQQEAPRPQSQMKPDKNEKEKADKAAKNAAQKTDAPVQEDELIDLDLRTKDDKMDWKTDGTRPTWTSTGFLQDGLWRFRQQIDKWKEVVPKANEDKKSQYLIYSCLGGCGGWADRQEGIVAAYLLAALTGRRFYIQHENPCSITDYYIPNKLDWRYTKKVENKLKDLPTVRLTALNIAAFKVGEVVASIDLDIILNKDVVYFVTNQDFYRYLQYNPRWKNLHWAKGMNRASVYAAVWEHLFRLSPSMEASMVAFAKSLNNTDGQGNRHKLACGQFRLKQNPSMPNDNEAHDFLDPRPIWDFLKDYNDLKEYRIFVASDSEDMRREAKYRFPETILDVPGGIVHIDLARKTKYLCEGFRKVLLDELALASCDVTMRGYNSHLGAIAAYWRGSEEDLYCYNGTVLEPCTTEDEFFHWGPTYEPSMTKHWEPFFQEIARRKKNKAKAEKKKQKAEEETVIPKDNR